MRAQDKIVAWISNRQAEFKNTNVHVEAQTDLLESGLLDSLDFLHLMTFIEEEYNVEIPVDKLSPENFCTAEVAGQMVEQLARS